ncbi:Endonuclease/exonuclease/phosphatase [Naviculisporaceae sp. PSN 640]
MARLSTLSGPVPVRVVTYNVRYATSRPVKGEEPWSVRRSKLCAQMRFIAAGQSSVFFCLQEVLYEQLNDIQDRLGPSWSHIGVGREDGDKAGEFSPIFFKVDNWTCERNKTYWLSPTPEKPSKGWDASLERIVTVGSFRHKKTGALVIVMATHFDHAGKLARENSSRLIVKLASEWKSGSSEEAQAPLFLGGDFNSTPEEEAYKALVEPGTGMKDVSGLLPDDLKYGNPEITYTSFGEPNERPKRIDFLFVHESSNVKLLGFAILDNRHDDGVFLSDHRPVVLDLEIPPPK